METLPNSPLTSLTKPYTKHPNVANQNQELTNRIPPQSFLPTWQQPRNSASYNTRPTKRATCQQTPPLELYPRVAACKKQAASYAPVPSNQTTNVHGHNADLRR
jgi:hypothetical protein